VDDETAEALMMLLSSQSDFNMRLITILISITKALPEEKQGDVAKSMVHLIEEYKAGLDDMNAFHKLLYKGRFNDE
jgi:hypothetical protein